VLLLTAYSAGLAIPFLIASVQIGLVTAALRNYAQAMHYIEVGMGVVLIIVGVLLMSGKYQQLSGFAGFLGAYDELALGRVMLILLVVFVVLGSIPAYIAYRKGRNFFTWWFFGATLFPVALPAAWLLVPKSNPGIVERPESEGSEVSAGTPI
jgi:preprotein translocase subunit SecG